MKSQKRKVPAVRTAKPTHAALHRGPVLFQRPPEPTEEEVIAVNRQFSAAHAAVAAVRPARFASPRNWQAWQTAVGKKYALCREHVTLFAQHFSREVIPPAVACYDWDFWRDMELLKGGDQVHLEQAVSFLEADPWFHGSGYAKEDIIPALNRLPLSSGVAARLVSVVLNMVDRRNGREFRAYKQLACKVDNPELREQLTQRVDQSDFDVRRRARWVLEALAQKDRMEQGRKAREQSSNVK